MSSQQVSDVRRVQRRAQLNRSVAAIAEGLEGRTLFNATQISPITPVQLAPSTSSTTIDLNQHFTDPLITGSVVLIETSLEPDPIPVELFDNTTPKTVANFLQYVNSGEYAATVIQRAVPGFILQGGGFTADQSHIATTGTVPNEFSVSNTEGTIAMALSTDPNTHLTDPNSATSDWFINDGNNSASLDPQKFTVFGKVLYNGMKVVNDIEALPKFEVSPNFLPAAGDPSSGVLPLQNYNVGSPVHPSNYVYTQAIVTQNPLIYTVTSDNTSLVNGTLNGTDLTIVAGAGQGLAHLTITATDLGGNVVQQVLTVQVGATQVTLGSGAARSLTFADPDGTHSVITFSGSGLATVAFTGLNLNIGGNASAKTLSGTPLGVTISTTGTSGANSTLTITGKGGSNKMVDIAGIRIDAPMRSINAPNTNLTADLTDTGGSVGSLTLGSVTSANVTFDSGSTRFTVGTMNTASIFGKGISALSANSWSGGGLIDGTALGQIRIKGSFVGGLTADSVKSFSARSIGSGSWVVSGAINLLTAKGIDSLRAQFGSLGTLMNLGAMTSSRLNVSGNIKSLTTNSMTGSTVYAGVASSNFPSTNSDFSSTQTISTLTVKGAFASSNIAAAHFTSLSLGPITYNNNGATFGVAALSIKQLKLLLNKRKVMLRNVTSSDQISNVFTALAITPQDLAIRIL